MLERIGQGFFILMLLSPIALGIYTNGWNGYFFGVGFALNLLAAVTIAEELIVWLIKGEKPFQSFRKTNGD